MNTRIIFALVLPAFVGSLCATPAAACPSCWEDLSTPDGSPHPITRPFGVRYRMMQRYLAEATQSMEKARRREAQKVLTRCMPGGQLAACKRLTRNSEKPQFFNSSKRNFCRVPAANYPRLEARKTAIERCEENWEMFEMLLTARIQEIHAKRCRSPRPKAEDCYWAGTSARRPNRGRPYLRKACQLGHLLGCSSFARNLQRGTQGSPREAARAAKKACYGKKNCSEWMGLYRSGFAPGGWPKVLEIRQWACKNFDRHYCYTAGAAYFSGKRVRQNIPLAHTLFERGCDGGIAQACDALACGYFSGSLGQPIDRPRGESIYQRRCKKHPEPECRAPLAPRCAGVYESLMLIDKD